MKKLGQTVHAFIPDALFHKTVTIALVLFAPRKILVREGEVKPMTNDSKMTFVETVRQRLSNQCSRLRLSRKLHRDDLQDCEWERRMKQLNPAWNPSSQSLDAYL